MFDVFYAKGGRIGSVIRSDADVEKLRQGFHVSLIQEDASGTRHWDVTAPRSPFVRRARAGTLPVKVIA